MQTATYIALTQQTVTQSGIDVLANNLANLSTPAYKGQSDLFAQYLLPGPNGSQIAYTCVVGVRRDTKQGGLSQTGNSLDAAIDGQGYFSVETNDGPRYTRNGRFQLNAAGNIVTSQGYQLLSDQGTPITLPRNTKTITIGPDGQVATDTGPVAKIGLSHFDNEQDLVSAADGLYVTTDQPTPDTTSKLQQGMVEDSNVNAISALTKLLGMTKAYAGAQQMIDGEDSRIKNAIDKLSRTA
jgi:flagellar basal-body rod protein FlgF